jgi:transcriptional regulatory protein LevR
MRIFASIKDIKKENHQLQQVESIVMHDFISSEKIKFILKILSNRDIILKISLKNSDFLVMSLTITTIIKYITRSFYSTLNYANLNS